MEVSASPSAPAPPSTSEVARRFCADAREGRVAAGAQVRMRDLMATYGTSRAAAQGAIAILRRQGLLVPDLRRRLVLRVPTRSEVREIMALRAALETLALELAMERLDEPDLERLYEAMVRLRAAIVDSRWQIDRADTSAFNRLARAIRSPMLLRMIAGLHYDSRSFQALLADLRPSSSAAAEGDHLEEMRRALISRDVATACRLHRAHIERRAAWVTERLPETG